MSIGHFGRPSIDFHLGRGGSKSCAISAGISVLLGVDCSRRFGGACSSDRAFEFEIVW